MPFDASVLTRFQTVQHDANALEVVPSLMDLESLPGRAEPDFRSFPVWTFQRSVSHESAAIRSRERVLREYRPRWV